MDAPEPDSRVPRLMYLVLALWILLCTFALGWLNAF
jgi:hypothetical protein